MLFIYFIFLLLFAIPSLCYADAPSGGFISFFFLLPFLFIIIGIGMLLIFSAKKITQKLSNKEGGEKTGVKGVIFHIISFTIAISIPIIQDSNDNFVINDLSLALLIMVGEFILGYILSFVLLSLLFGRNS